MCVHAVLRALYLAVLSCEYLCEYCASARCVLLLNVMIDMSRASVVVRTGGRCGRVVVFPTPDLPRRDRWLCRMCHVVCLGLFACFVTSLRLPVSPSCVAVDQVELEAH